MLISLNRNISFKAVHCFAIPALSDKNRSLKLLKKNNTAAQGMWVTDVVKYLFVFEFCECVFVFVFDILKKPIT